MFHIYHVFLKERNGQKRRLWPTGKKDFCYYCQKILQIQNESEHINEHYIVAENAANLSAIKELQNVQQYVAEALINNVPVAPAALVCGMFTVVCLSSVWTFLKFRDDI